MVELDVVQVLNVSHRSGQFPTRNGKVLFQPNFTFISTLAWDVMCILAYDIFLDSGST